MCLNIRWVDNEKRRDPSNGHLDSGELNIKLFGHPVAHHSNVQLHFLKLADTIFVENDINHKFSAICCELTLTHDTIYEGTTIKRARILPGCTFVQQNISSSCIRLGGQWFESGLGMPSLLSINRDWLKNETTSRLKNKTMSWLKNETRSRLKNETKTLENETIIKNQKNNGDIWMIGRWLWPN